MDKVVSGGQGKELTPQAQAFKDAANKFKSEAEQFKTAASSVTDSDKGDLEAIKSEFLVAAEKFGYAATKFNNAAQADGSLLVDIGTKFGKLAGALTGASKALEGLTAAAQASGSPDPGTGLNGLTAAADKFKTEVESKFKEIGEIFTKLFNAFQAAATAITPPLGIDKAQATSSFAEAQDALNSIKEKLKAMGGQFSSLATQLQTARITNIHDLKNKAQDVGKNARKLLTTIQTQFTTLAGALSSSDQGQNLADQFKELAGKEILRIFTGNASEFKDAAIEFKGLVYAIPISSGHVKEAIDAFKEAAGKFGGNEDDSVGKAFHEFAKELETVVKGGGQGEQLTNLAGQFQQAASAFQTTIYTKKNCENDRFYNKAKDIKEKQGAYYGFHLHIL